MIEAVAIIVLAILCVPVVVYAFIGIVEGKTFWRKDGRAMARYGLIFPVHFLVIISMPAVAWLYDFFFVSKPRL